MTVYRGLIDESPLEHVEATPPTPAEWIRDTDMQLTAEVSARAPWAYGRIWINGLESTIDDLATAVHEDAAVCWDRDGLFERMPSWWNSEREFAAVRVWTVYQEVIIPDAWAIACFGTEPGGKALVYVVNPVPHWREP